MNAPSAVRFGQVPEARVLDNSRQTQQFASIGREMIARAQQSQAEKKAKGLANDLMKDPQAALETANVNAAEQQQIEAIQNKAEAERQQVVKTSNMQRIIGEPENKAKLIELMQLDPELGKQTLDIMSLEDQQQKAQFAAQMKETNDIFNNAGVILETQGKEGLDAYLMEVARPIYQQGGDVSKLLQIKQMGPDEAAAQIERNRAMTGSVLKVPEVQKTMQSIGKVSPENYTTSSLQKFNQTGNYDDLQVRPEKAEKAGGAISKPSPKDFTTESIARYQETGNAADLKRYSSASSKRGQETINQGLTAAQGVPNLKRAVSLLSEIKTGGLNSALLRAKQAFGVEGADEAELSNNLGKAVLGQLKDTFGSAFTEKEGARLDRLSANYGKSPKGNIRILNQALKMSEMKVKQAKIRAEAVGDFETIAEMDAYLDFDMGDSAPVDSGGGPVNADQLRQEAAQAIANGAPREAVEARLQQMLNGG